MDLGLIVEETSLTNRMVLGSLLPNAVWDPLPHFLQTWLRNYIAGSLLYLLTGFLWSFYIYHYRKDLLPEDAIPSTRAMRLQVYVAMKAMPGYSLLPAVSEYMIENGWTRCFPRISDVGWAAYVINVAAYLVIVEFMIYWVHRGAHDIKSLYKFHATHHIYNKENTISPFAGKLFIFLGWAFHPLDGIWEALPHVIALFIVPMHFKTYTILLFMESIWTSNIHDCINEKLWPLMGAGYHVIHHTTYRHNYGHYTIWMDWMFGTLRPPADDEAKEK